MPYFKKTKTPAPIHTKMNQRIRSLKNQYIRKVENRAWVKRAEKILERNGETQPSVTNDLWLPSQKGGFFVALHRQKYNVFFSGTSNLKACRPVPLWEPSQNG